VQTLLTRRGDAVRRRDAAALRAGAAGPLRDAGRTLLRRTAEVPFAGYAYRLDPAEPLAASATASRLTAEARLEYRITGHDARPATAARRLSFERQDGRWLLAAEKPVGVLLWDLGAVRAVHGARCLVLGLGDDPGPAVLAEAADRAVPAVEAVWGTGWTDRLLLYAPARLDQLARLLNATADAYRGIAAVTTAAPGAPDHAPADRIMVNPEAYARLSDLGRQVVTTHEAVHVATRADTRPWTPLWLSEGVADWTAYLGTDRTPRQIAPELAHDLAEGRLPRALPSDADFGTTASGLAQAYELAWLACRLIARRRGRAALVDLYRQVGATGSATADRGTTVDRALRRVLGTGLAGFTEDWLRELKRELG
jgi:hypothetical protein